MLTTESSCAKIHAAPLTVRNSAQVPQTNVRNSAQDLRSFDRPDQRRPRAQSGAIHLELPCTSPSTVDMQKPDVSHAREELIRGGGSLYPFRHGYARLAQLLDTLPPDAWRQDEAVLGGLVMHLLKRGQASRAKSYLQAVNLAFEKTYQFELLDLLLALHLGEPVSDEKLGSWRRLERELPISNALLQGLYYNAMMAMFVRLLRLEDARVAGQQAISCYREDGHAYLEHFIHIHLADLDVVDGRLRRAARGLRTAERCLDVSGARYGNEAEVIEVIRLAIEYERGNLERVRQRAPHLRNSLLTGDSWSELFYQLARIGVMSTYFLEGRQAAQIELETYQADYARRHSGAPLTIDVLEAQVSHLEWHPNEAERQLEALSNAPIQSSVGQIIRAELQAALRLSEPPPPTTPRGAIVAALQDAQRARGKLRRQCIERAMRLALEERQIAPFIEHRDVFLGASGHLTSAQFLRGNAALSRLAKQIVRAVEQSYVVPEKLQALGFNSRQYRVAAALQSGSSNKQIARQLGTSEATVKYHLTSVYRLAGVTKRSHLIDLMSDIDLFAIS